MNMLDRHNEHLFLEHQDLNGNSFIANINKTAINIDEIKKFNDYIEEGKIAELVEAVLVGVEEAGNKWLVQLQEVALALTAAKSAFNFATLVTIPEDIASGAEIELPDLARYTVGTHMLMVSYNGTTCYIGEQYEEIGEIGETSKKIKMLFDLRANDKIMFRVIALNSETILDELPVRAEGSTEYRTLEERFGDIVNVKDFGAKGDGITDDTEAIQKAAKNAVNATLFFPKGEYCISDTIEIYSNGGGTYVHLGESAISWIGEEALDDYSQFIENDMSEETKYNIKEYGYAFYGKPMIKINWGAVGVGTSSRAIVSGGYFNGNMKCAVAIKIDGFNALIHGVRVSNVKWCGIAICGDDPSTARSMGAQISDCYLVNINSPGYSYGRKTIGIFVHDLDNSIENTISNFFWNCIVLRSSGNHLSNGHSTVQFKNKQHSDGKYYIIDGDGNFLDDYPDCSNLVIDPNMQTSISGTNWITNWYFNSGKNAIKLQDSGTLSSTLRTRMMLMVNGGSYLIKSDKQRVLGKDYNECFVVGGDLPLSVNVQGLMAYTPPYVRLRDYFVKRGLHWTFMDVQMDFAHTSYPFGNDLLTANNLISYRSNDPVQLSSYVYTIPFGKYARIAAIMQRFNVSGTGDSFISSSVDVRFENPGIHIVNCILSLQGTGQWVVRDIKQLAGTNTNDLIFIDNTPNYITINGISYVYWNIYYGGKIGDINKPIFLSLHPIMPYSKVYAYRLHNGDAGDFITEQPSNKVIVIGE